MCSLSCHALRDAANSLTLLRNLLDRTTKQPTITRSNLAFAVGARQAKIAVPAVVGYVARQYQGPSEARASATTIGQELHSSDARSPRAARVQPTAASGPPNAKGRADATGFARETGGTSRLAYRRLRTRRCAVLPLSPPQQAVKKHRCSPTQANNCLIILRRCHRHHYD